MTLAGLNEKTHLLVILDLIELIFYIYCSVLVAEWSEQGGTANIVVDNCEAST